MANKMVKVSLEEKIDTLNKIAVEVFPANKVFKLAIAILGLVKEKMLDNNDPVQLSKYCFDVCETLQNSIRGKIAGDLVEFEKMVVEDLERDMREVEQTLRWGTSAPNTQYDREKVERHMLKIQQTIATLHAMNPSVDESLGVDMRASHLTSTGHHNGAAIYGSESACERLIRRRFAPHELPSIVEAILSNRDEGDKINCLPAAEAQTLINVIDEALHVPGLPPWAQKMCIKLLYRTCGRHALLPGALMVSVDYDRAGNSPRRGGYADVWKAEYCGRDVAVKVIRTYTNRELGKVLHKFCKEAVMWRFLEHPNVLPLTGVMVSENLFAMVSDWMADGDINEFIEAHPDVNRLGLLGEVAQGLIYLHCDGLVHGDIKGANILIDNAGHPRLADFGLLTVISDPANLLSSSSNAQGGTIRWMSPELIAPQQFGLRKSRPTKASDCYAFGMVIYETISRRLPFHTDTDYTISLKVVRGERPSRGARFTNYMWGILGSCWTSQPNNRPSIEDVLQCLEIASNSSEPPVPGEEVEMDSDERDSSDSSSPFHTGTRGTMAEWNTPIRSGWDHATNNSLVAPAQGQIPQEVPSSVGLAGGYHYGSHGFGMNPQSTGTFSQGYGTLFFQGSGSNGTFSHPQLLAPVFPTSHPTM